MKLGVNSRGSTKNSDNTLGKSTVVSVGSKRPYTGGTHASSYKAEQSKPRIQSFNNTTQVHQFPLINSSPEESRKSLDFGPAKPPRPPKFLNSLTPLQSKFLPNHKRSSSVARISKQVDTTAQTQYKKFLSLSQARKGRLGK